jgi:hypothetical protein
MDRELHNLRRELARIERGPGCWYPPELRDRITSWVRRQRADGIAWRELADEIGMSWRTLLRWTSPRTARAWPALVPVEVVANTVDRNRAIRIVTPGGLRIEGITIADAITLARELG